MPINFNENKQKSKNLYENLFIVEIASSFHSKSKIAYLTGRVVIND